MAKKRKLYVENTVLFITSRVEKDLPFPAYPLINTTLLGILARAKSLYDISICHFVFMSNHFHLLAVVRNPADVPNFIRLLKLESAAAINRICGVRQNTVWTNGFDDPIVLTSDKVIDTIKYIYKNPAAADLVNSIEQYPGLSSWSMFRRGEHQKECVWLRRSQFHKIENLGLMTDKKQQEIINTLAGDEPIFHTFELEPNAWLECFPEYKNADSKELSNRIIKEVLQEERKLEHPRGVVGVKKLKTQAINKKFKSAKYGKRMLCISSNLELRKTYINYLKTITQLAKKTYKSIKNGVCNILLPAGTFMPGGSFLTALKPELFLA
ncbi:MAG: transposase [Deltaproteobacteria bacterium]|jgi:REP element-mobilizing transposase RayT|nr:transposase [Deltaproteobacteria bacterium]